MATRNYRQAKRSREASRKKRQEEKMLRKTNRGVATATAPDIEPDQVAPTNKTSP